MSGGVGGEEPRGFPLSRFFMLEAGNQVWYKTGLFWYKTGPKTWSRRRDLNPRPSDYKSDALPTELRRHVNFGRAMERGTGFEPV